MLKEEEEGKDRERERTFYYKKDVKFLLAVEENYFLLIFRIFSIAYLILRQHCGHSDREGRYYLPLLP